MDNLLPKDIFHPLDTDHIINKKISSLTDQKKYDNIDSKNYIHNL